MIKRLLMIVAAVIGISTAAGAKDTYTHDATVLPKAAQTVLSKNFKADVSVVKIEKRLGQISEFEVILTDGSEITFDKHGNWENIEVRNQSSVPAALIPSAIATSVKSQQPGQRIVGIEKERSGYEVELSNGVEMKFDKNGKFLRYDD